MLLAKGLLDYMHPYYAPLATREQLAHAHSSLYVAELMDASPAEGYHRVDPDTEMNPFTVRAALRAAGAVVQATDLVVAGEVPSAFCCVRPPGHHAERAAAMGFCFFNNVAVGIRHALTEHGVQRVALIDFDVHHGNGSEDIFRGDERVCSCAPFLNKAFTHSPEKTPPARIWSTWACPLARAVTKFRGGDHPLDSSAGRLCAELIYISAGFDGHREDDMGNLGLVEPTTSGSRSSSWRLPGATAKGVSFPAWRAAMCSARWPAAWRPTSRC
jgi:acetoin utilization deacetylase AcuC-like enzyme